MKERAAMAVWDARTAVSRNRISPPQRLAAARRAREATLVASHGPNRRVIGSSDQEAIRSHARLKQRGQGQTGDADADDQSAQSALTGGGGGGGGGGSGGWGGGGGWGG
jgi:hypothetical protein